MTEQCVVLKATTVELLICGSSHLYGPAFPDDEERKRIFDAVDRAERKLESIQTETHETND